VLSPYRVLDLTDERGHLAGQILAELGADVIAVEPHGGHRSRRLAPFAGSRWDPGASLTHAAYNRGKRSVVIGEPTQLERLAGTADILLDCGAFAALDLARLRALYPALITVSITAFGQTGPKSSWAATDLTLCAAAGTLGMAGAPDRPPVRVSVPQAFLFAAADAACAALLALWERHRTGRGQHADISAQQSYHSATQFQAMTALVGKPAGKRLGGGMRIGSVTMLTVHPCRDGHVTASFLFGPVFGPYARRLFAWIHEEGFCSGWWANQDWISFGQTLREDPKALGTMEEGIAIMRRFIATKTKAELFSAAVQRRLLIAPVMTARDLLGFEHLRARGWWQSIDGVPVPGNFARSATSPLRQLGRAPCLGEHQSILDEPLRAPNLAPVDGHAAKGARSLQGVRVLDFAWALAGPGGTRILADHGATVVRVESQHKMDILRGTTPFIGDDTGPEDALSWHTANAGKLGFTLDLRHPRARAVVLDLAKWADIVVESFSSGTMERMGIGYEALRAANPRVIMISSCLLGASGPLRQYAGFGGAGAAIAGFYALTGWPDGLPVGPYGAYSDYTSPRFMVAALLGALEWRRRTGQGQHIDFSQMEAAVQMIAPVLLDEAVNGHCTGRCGNDDPHMSPHGVYPVLGEDRWVAMAVESDAQWRALAGLLRHPESTDWRVEQRRARRGEIDSWIGEWTAVRDGVEVERSLRAHGVPAHCVSHAADLVADPQLRHRVQWLQVPHAVHGLSWVEGPAIRLSRTPGEPRWAGPTYGQHVSHVLTEILQYNADQVAGLIAENVLE